MGTCFYLIFVFGVLFSECMKGLYLYEDRCESVCPAKTYPGINVKERSACLPCHYTCLTCVGELDSQCTSCYDEAVAVASESHYQGDDFKKLELVNHTDDPGIFPLPKLKVTEDTLALDDDNAHWSYGKRDTDLLVNRDIRKKAVTKKILENYNKPRPLYYCYPARVVEEINSSAWYYRMTVLFFVNFILLVSFLLYYLYAKCCISKSSSYAHISDLRYKYSKMKNGDSNVIKPGSPAHNIIYVSTSEEE